MIFSPEDFWELFRQWKNERLQVDVRVFLHRQSDAVLVSTMRGFIDSTDDEGNVMISADAISRVRFNLLNAKLGIVTMAELSKLANNYAEQLGDKETQREYIDPFLLLIFHDGIHVSVSMTIAAIRRSAIH